MYELAEIADDMVEYFIFTAAKGGYNFDKGEEDYSYRERKEKDGWKAWDEMEEEEREERKEQALVECECVKRKKVSYRKYPVRVPDKNCLCRGSGKRKMLSKERRSLEYAEKKREEQFQRDERGRDSCVDYVMDSVDLAEKIGCWKEPLETDGWVVDRSWVPGMNKEKRCTINFPVKIFKGTELVEIVDKGVSVMVVGEKCREEWRPLLRKLSERRKQLEADIRNMDNGWRRRNKEIDLDIVSTQIGKLITYGDCIRGEDACRKVLQMEDFVQVQHLWQ